MDVKSVIIIDDEFAKTKELGQLLVSDGYIVKIASNKDEAVAMTIKMMPRFIIIKAILIDASEFDIIRGLRSIDALKTIPIVMVTESDEDYNDISVISKYKPDYGIVKVIQIPMDEDEFLSQVRSIEDTNDDEQAGNNYNENQANSEAVYSQPEYIINENNSNIEPDFKDNKDTLDKEIDLSNFAKDNVEGEIIDMAERKHETVPEKNEPHIHYEEQDFVEVSENEKAQSTYSISTLLELFKGKKILTVLMIGVVIIIFISMILTKISKKNDIDKENIGTTESGREIVTIVEPPGKSALSTTSEDKTETVIVEETTKLLTSPKNPPLKPEKTDKVASSSVSNPVTKKEEDVKSAPKIEQKTAPETAPKTINTLSKISQKDTASHKPEPVVNKHEPKTAIVKKPVKPSHSPNSETISKVPEKTETQVSKPKVEQNLPKTIKPSKGQDTSSKPDVKATKSEVKPSKGQDAPSKPEVKATKPEVKPLKGQDTSSSDGEYKIQIGVYDNSANAISILNKLQNNNYKGVIKEIHKKDKIIYLVTIGEYSSRKEAVAVALRLKTINKIDGIVIKK